MTPQDWNRLLASAVPWQEAYAVVERETRLYLAAQDATKTTAGVVEALYPISFAAKSEAGAYARERIFKALAALAKNGLKDCATRGEARMANRNSRFGKRMVQPWTWHPPRSPPSGPAPAQTCPHCRKEIF